MRFRLELALYAAIAAANFATAFSGARLDWRFWCGLFGATAVAVKAKLSPGN